ncbi:MAG: SDR family oxidoreductase [Armatimonadetes bacterium]|nr:SDR family oxidoreductase [Armatimonadota bacterium]
MDLGIRGRVALIGASGRGLGLATATRLAMEGCHIAICDKDTAVLEGALAQVKAAATSTGETIKAFAYPVDLTSAQDIDRLAADVRRDLGPVGILVTNSGGPPPGGFEEATDEKWVFAYSLTFLSAVRLIRAVLPDMKAQKWGRIINFTSRSLREPIPNLIISNSVRLAVGGMAKTLAGEVAKYGITVNNVCPGPTTTDRAIELAKARAAKKGISYDEEMAATVKGIPLGRLAKPEEQAAAVAFLCSEPAGYVTGISLLVDGGAVQAL